MKRGFTLIELLAVIVILAIIALIAVPIVIHIINDSKKSSDEQSIELYMKLVQTAVTKENLERNLSPKRCMINTEGNLVCDKDENNSIKIEIKGKKPTDGVITFKENKIYKYRNIKIDNLYYHKNSKGIITSTIEPKFYTTCKSTTGSVSIELGTKYECEVNDDTIYSFYVLSTENDNKTINLIMDRNICEDGGVDYTEQNNYCTYAWHSGEQINNYGPDTAMTILYKATKEWDSVPDMIMDYSDEENQNSDTLGYVGIKTENGVTTITGKQNKTSNEQIIGNFNKPLKSRIAKNREISGAGCTGRAGSCPVWLMGNINYYDVTSSVGIDKYSMNNNSQSHNSGYWLLASHYDRIMFARAIRFLGNWHSYNWLQVNSTDRYGLRPVITVPEDYLS